MQLMHYFNISFISKKSRKPKTFNTNMTKHDRTEHKMSEHNGTKNKQSNRT